MYISCHVFRNGTVAFLKHLCSSNAKVQHNLFSINKVKNLNKLATWIRLMLYARSYKELETMRSYLGDGVACDLDGTSPAA